MADSTVPPRSTGVLHLTQFRGAAILFVCSVLAAKGLGYVRDAYILWAFGVGRNTDAYTVAFTVPNLLSYLVAGGALSITFIPILDSLREANREAEGNRVLSIVATFMGLLLIAGTLLGEWLAPAFLHWYEPKFTAEELRQCLIMTRILLPAPLFFCMGGLLSAQLYTRGAFLIPALTPLIYNLGTLVGGVLLGRRLGITSLAIGTVTGAFLGPFLLPLLATIRDGLRYRPSLDLADPYFRKWLMTTVPLMLGVSIVTADDWFIQYFAGGTAGAISLLTYAKRLTAVPVAVLGQAVGQAAMPFFSKLANEKKWDVFRETVDRSVARTVMAGVLAISLLEALSFTAVRLVYERGRFTDSNAHLTAIYFSIFMIALICWISQGIYSRAFYATGNTLAPMLQSTIVTVITVPFYWLLLRRFGIVGLAWASDLAIVIQTISLAWLLRRKGLLQLDRHRWTEIGRVAVAGAVAWAIASAVGRSIEPEQYNWLYEIGVAASISLTWLTVIALLSRLLRLDSVKAEAVNVFKKLRLA